MKPEDFHYWLLVLLCLQIIGVPIAVFAWKKHRRIGQPDIVPFPYAIILSLACTIWLLAMGK